MAFPIPPFEIARDRVIYASETMYNIIALNEPVAKGYPAILRAFGEWHHSAETTAQRRYIEHRLSDAPYIRMNFTTILRCSGGYSYLWLEAHRDLIPALDRVATQARLYPQYEVIWGGRSVLSSCMSRWWHGTVTAGADQTVSICIIDRNVCNSSDLDPYAVLGWRLHEPTMRLVTAYNARMFLVMWAYGGIVTLPSLHMLGLPMTACWAAMMLLAAFIGAHMHRRPIH